MDENKNEVEKKILFSIAWFPRPGEYVKYFLLGPLHVLTANPNPVRLTGNSL